MNMKILQVVIFCVISVSCNGEELVRMAKTIIQGGITERGHLTPEARSQAIALVKQSLKIDRAEPLGKIPVLQLAVDLLTSETEGTLPMSPAGLTDSTTHILHIPKNAGTSLSAAVQSCPSGCAVFHGHSTRLDDLPDVNVLALVRSPVDRFISSYVFYKQGGYRGAHRRLSDHIATQEATQALQYQQLAVSILTHELENIEGTTRETTSSNLKMKLAQMLDKLSYMIWASEGDPLKAHQTLTTAIQIYKSMDIPLNSDIRVRLDLLSRTLEHPIHRYASVTEFVEGLMRGDVSAWRALHCQENMIIREADREVCGSGGSRDVMRFHLAFRSQMAWLMKGPVSRLHLLSFEDLAACASQNSTVRSCLGIPCDAHIPHMNGRAHSAESYLAQEAREWIERMYASDQTLYSCVKANQTSRDCLLNARLLQPGYELSEGDVPGLWL